MKTIVFQTLAICLALALVQRSAPAQYAPTTIESIVISPEKYSSAAVEVTGQVTLFAPAASSSTSHYLLKSESGSVIRVNTTEGAPDMYKKYKVTGIVYIDPVNKVPFISEKSRVRADVPPPVEQAPEVKETNPLEDYWWVGAIVLIAAGLLVFFLTRKKPPAPAKPAVEQEQPPVESAAPPPPTYVPPSDLKTIRIMPPALKTMRYVPGELVLATGEDKGKAFKFAGFPTPEGSIVTIGREPVTGDRAYAHIQIDEKFHTVSRRQAELIWKDNKLYVKNLSETNPTQVNGAELKPGKMVHLKPGSIIRTGELEFQYNA
jgi:hypothetical protein